uniref:CID domain-containing protein n=1 Tax=Parascaris univalens TaxID=6257 RepID=A0A915BVR6_PARUN
MALSEDIIARRLRTVDHSSESIQTTSMWILHHKDSVTEIVNCWMDVFKAADDALQVALFYVANDVCQKAKKRADSHALLVAFAPHWISAIAHSRNSETVRKAVVRILDIFDQRQIYSKSQLADMRSSLSDGSETDENALLDFDTTSLIREMESYQKGDMVMERAREVLARSDFTFKDKIKSRVKDRREGEKVLAEIDQSYKKLSGFLEALTKHKGRGDRLAELIEEAKKFYTLQLRDVTVVEDAYRKFGVGISVVRSEVEEMLKTGVYPGASPPRDAPSPTANDDPFVAGVEQAFNEMRKPKEDSTESVDMDVEKDDDHIVTDSLHVKTNQSFAGASDALLRMMQGVTSRSFQTPTQTVGTTDPNGALQPQQNPHTSSTQFSQANSSAISTTVASAGVQPISEASSIPPPSQPLSQSTQATAHTLHQATPTALHTVSQMLPHSVVPSSVPPSSGLMVCSSDLNQRSQLGTVRVSASSQAQAQVTPSNADRLPPPTVAQTVPHMADAGPTPPAAQLTSANQVVPSQPLPPQGVPPALPPPWMLGPPPSVPSLQPFTARPPPPMPTVQLRSPVTSNLTQPLAVYTQSSSVFTEAAAFMSSPRMPLSVPGATPSSSVPLTTSLPHLPLPPFVGMPSMSHQFPAAPTTNILPPTVPTQATAGTQYQVGTNVIPPLSYTDQFQSQGSPCTFSAAQVAGSSQAEIISGVSGATEEPATSAGSYSRNPTALRPANDDVYRGHGDGEAHRGYHNFSHTRSHERSAATKHPYEGRFREDHSRRREEYPRNGNRFDSTYRSGNAH